MGHTNNHAAADAKWLWQEFPDLDETACTGCEICCVLCPTDCLEMRRAVPWMPRPAECIGCAVCALVCPADALRMRRFGQEC
jgi:2-oxoglutarate ferredoxin oxidoreductase subunit delta